MNENLAEVARELLIGAVDFHIHAFPDTVQRSQDMIEIAKDARGYGMKAVVFKDHNTITADRAYLVNKIVPGVKSIGGIALNYSVGGLNPIAVEAAIKMGGKIVWMPGIDSAWTIHQIYVDNVGKWLEPFVRFKDPRRGISVLRGGLEGKELLPEVKDILSIIEENNVILDILHLSPKEREVIVKEANEYGIEKIILTHPNCDIGFADIDEQKRLVSQGVYMCYAFLPCMPMFDRQNPAIISKMFKAVGAEKCLLCTDFGQIVNPPPVEGLKLFILHLLASGISRKEIELATSKNPAELLELK